MAVPLSLGPVHHLRLTVTDVERSREFYTELLGFQIAMDAPPLADDPHHDLVVQALQGGIVMVNGAAMLVAGVALACGVWPRLAAATLAGTIVPTTLAGHPYWRIEDPAARHQQRIHFFKNVGLFGGALLVLAERPARRRRHRRRHRR